AIMARIRELAFAPGVASQQWMTGLSFPLAQIDDLSQQGTSVKVRCSRSSHSEHAPSSIGSLPATSPSVTAPLLLIARLFCQRAAMIAPGYGGAFLMLGGRHPVPEGGGLDLAGPPGRLLHEA